MTALKLDPTRTTSLRQKFVSDVRRRFMALRQRIVQRIAVEDVYGLAPVTFNVERQFAFLTNKEKIRHFKSWLKDQVDSGVLEVSQEYVARPWMAPYIESAYKKGVTRAYVDSQRKLKGIAPSREAFLVSSFSSPTARETMELLATRSFENLRGITNAMSTEMNRIFADAVVHGQGPREVARELTRTIDGMTRKRALVLARTEIIHAHAEGQLDSFQKLGIEEVNVQVEWSTAGDDRVCAQCEAMAGEVMSIAEARGLIPLHPNCRCAWIPAL